jgi:hypothetical protein
MSVGLNSAKLREMASPKFWLASLGLVCFLIFVFAGLAAAQDIQTGVTYVCNGEPIFIENCNIRDTSDTANCLVRHPNWSTKYTYETRGNLKKLLPTCKQPSAADLAKVQAQQKKAQDAQNTALARSGFSSAPPPPPKTPPPSSTQNPGSGFVAVTGGGNPKVIHCVESGQSVSKCISNGMAASMADSTSSLLGTFFGNDIKSEMAQAPVASVYVTGTFHDVSGTSINFQ